MYLKKYEPASPATEAINLLIAHRNMKHERCLAIAELDIVIRQMTKTLGLPAVETIDGCCSCITSS